MSPSSCANESMSRELVVARSFSRAVVPAAGGGERGASDVGWLKSLLINKLARGDQTASRWVGLAQKLSGFDELNRLLSQIEAGGHLDRLTAMAEAMGIRFEFEGLDNIKAVGKRPALLFANHPTGAGNVLGLSILLASRFPEHRILGNQHMRFLGSLSEKMIPVDPFSSTAPINLQSLARLRQEFGTQYQALGVFPAGMTARLEVNGAITDRPWSDAFIRIARHHDALLVPVWFSGRNRLRFYIANRILVDLGYLALPAEFLRLRGQTIKVRIGSPIDPFMLRMIPSRAAQLNFLRASVYDLAAAGPEPAPKQNKRVRPSAPVARTIAAPVAGSLPFGERLEARFLDGAAAMRIKSIAATADRELNGATYHVLVTPRGCPAPCLHWQVLDWSEWSSAELDRLSPARRAFRMPSDLARPRQHWLEIVSFGASGDSQRLALLPQIAMAMRELAPLAGTATDLIALVRTPERNAVPASLQFALMQRMFPDPALQRANAKVGLIGAARHHDWRPQRDLGAFDQPSRLEEMRSIDPLLRRLAGIGFRFGAAALVGAPAPQPAVLGRLSLTMGVSRGGASHDA
jgi:putative hemolysin